MQVFCRILSITSLTWLDFLTTRYLTQCYLAVILIMLAVMQKSVAHSENSTSRIYKKSINSVPIWSHRHIYVVFTAELIVLNLSFNIILCSKHKKFAIFSYSLSSLLAIHNWHLQIGFLLTFIPSYIMLAKQSSYLDSTPYWY